MAPLSETGVFKGSPDDLRDGFIHLSFACQLLGTLTGYFSADKSVVLAVIKPRDKTAYCLESSRGGVLFPHYYGILALTDVAKTVDLERYDGFSSQTLSLALQKLGIAQEGQSDEPL